MGCGASASGGGGSGTTAVAPAKPKQPKSEFDKRVAAALKRYKDTMGEKPKSERVNSFNQVLLRSGRLLKALDAVKDVFKKFDVDNSNSMDHGELVEALKVLGNHVSAEEAEKVFHEADLYDNNKLSEKEFVVCLLLGYVLGDLKLDSSAAEAKEGDGGIERKDTEVYYGHAEELKWAFNNIIGSYLLFGASRDCLFWVVFLFRGTPFLFPGVLASCVCDLSVSCFWWADRVCFVPFLFLPVMPCFSCSR
jgi:hypothetical protein